MSIEALFITAPNWKQPRGPSVGKQINYIWTMEYFIALKWAIKTLSLSAKRLSPEQGVHREFLNRHLSSACWVASVVSDSFQSYGLEPIRLPCPWDSPGKKNTRAGCHALLQGIFPIQRSNPCLLRLLPCRQVLYCPVSGKAQNKL